MLCLLLVDNKAKSHKEKLTERENDKEHEVLSEKITERENDKEHEILSVSITYLVSA